MAWIKYSEHYIEVDLNVGKRREFKRELEIEGSKDDIQELFPMAISFIPKYRFPLLRNDEDSDKKELLE